MIYSVKSVKAEIPISNSIIIKIENNVICITGTLGTVTHVFHKLVLACLDYEKNLLVISSKNSSSFHKSLVGTTRALIYGMIAGVTKGFIKKLKLVGIGYRVSIIENTLHFIIGLSHSVKYILPVEVTATCPNQTEIVLSSINKQIIGQVAADLRYIKPPEPFKGKGIRYADEIVHIKETKKR